MMNNNKTIDIESFEMFLKLIENKSGIKMPETNYKTLSSVIIERAESYQIPYHKYLSILERDNRELQIFLNQITINETYFFREEKQFKTLEHFFKAGYFEAPIIKIWSASCASGEEAVSLSIIAEEFYYKENEKDYITFATDINTNSLKSFEENSFSANSFRKDGSAYSYLINKYFIKNGNEYSLSDNIFKKIKIGYQNLFYLDKSELLKDNEFDIIFFRNTLIYMDMYVKEKVLKNIISFLKNNGLLFLGSSEVPLISSYELSEKLGLSLEEYNETYFFRKKEKSLSKNLDIENTNKVKDNSTQSFEYKILDKNKEPYLDIINVNNKNKENKELNNKKIEEDKIKIQEILEILNNKSLEKKCNRSYDDKTIKAAEMIESIFNKINKGELDKALIESDAFIKIYGTNEVITYLQGRIFNFMKKIVNAETMFHNSININFNFWPSHYELACIYISIYKDKALYEFKLTKQLISENISKHVEPYIFLLENFHESYFLNICDKWIDKLEKTKSKGV